MLQLASKVLIIFLATIPALFIRPNKGETGRRFSRIVVWRSLFFIIIGAKHPNYVD